MLALVTGSTAGVVVTDQVPVRRLVPLLRPWFPGLFAFGMRERVLAHLDQQRAMAMNVDQVVIVDERWRRLPA